MSLDRASLTRAVQNYFDEVLDLPYRICMLSCQNTTKFDSGYKLVVLGTCYSCHAGFLLLTQV